MSAQTLSRVTLQTLENYQAAANQAIVAYRAGSQRLVGAFNGALETRVYPRTAKLAPRATDWMNGVRGKVSDVVGKGIEQSAERAEQVLEFNSNVAAKQVTRIADYAAGIQNDTLNNGLQAVARLTMPGAQLALAVSGKIAEGATALAAAAGAPVKTSRKPARKPVARKAKAPIKAAAKRVAKAVKAETAAPVAKARRAVRVAKKAVAEAAAA